MSGTITGAGERAGIRLCATATAGNSNDTSVTASFSERTAQLIPTPCTMFELITIRSHGSLKYETLKYETLK
ncbi:MAG: hypothetical protein ACR2GG_07630 [Gemmatimonadaceae bacterium]